MKIGEAAKQTGLSVSNIRFYEKKGLLEPVRDQGSSYRNYTEEDIRRLKLILVYRKMEVPVEQIHEILSGKEDPRQVIRRQEQQLEDRIKELEGAVWLCRRMAEEEDPAQIDPDSYLQSIQQEERKGTKFGQITDLLEDFSDYTISGSQGAFLALFGGWASIAKLLASGGVWAVFVFCFVNACRQEPVYVQSIVFWGGLLAVYTVEFFQFIRKRKRGYSR